LTDDFVPSGPGVAVFAAAPPGYLHAVALPSRPLDEVTWSDRPALATLQAVLDDHERIAVALIDKSRARLFSVFVGAIEEERDFKDYVPGRHRTGGWHLLSQTRAQRHHDDLVAVHIRRVTAELMEMLRSRPFDHLIVAGPDEAISLLCQTLPRPLRARLAATLHLELFAGEAEILSAVERVRQEVDRAHGLRVVEELAGAAAAGQAVVGLSATLAALAEDRVFRLVVSDALAAVGARCTRCGRIAAGAGACPACGGQLGRASSLRDLLVEQALAEGAAVELVGAEAAERLAPYGGVGAFVRYAAVTTGEAASEPAAASPLAATG
jgi:peptide subunit release factor 1 (eRF1)